MFKRYFFSQLTLILIVHLCCDSAFAECTSKAIKQVRVKALSAYQNKEYATAAKTLSRHYDHECNFFEMIKSSDAVLNNGLWLISDLMLYHSQGTTKDLLTCLSLNDQVNFDCLLDLLKGCLCRCICLIHHSFLGLKYCLVTKKFFYRNFH